MSVITAQNLFTVLRKIPEEERKRMKIVVSDVDDECEEITDYSLCFSRVILHVNRSFQV